MNDCNSEQKLDLKNIDLYSEDAINIRKNYPLMFIE